MTWCFCKQPTVGFTDTRTFVSILADQYFVVDDVALVAVPAHMVSSSLLRTAGATEDEIK